MKQKVVAMIAIAVISGALSAQVSNRPTSPWSATVTPAVDIPLGVSRDDFSLGGALDLGLEYRLPTSIVSLLGGAEYCYAPTQGPNTLSLSALRVGAGANVPLTKFLGLYAFASGGYYYATLNTMSLSATDPYLAGGLGATFNFGPNFALTLGAQYKDYLGLWQGASAGIGTSIALGSAGAGAGAEKTSTPAATPRIQFLSTFSPAFPVFYKYYNDHPIGTLHIDNHSGLPLSNIKVEFYVKQYMDEPKEVDLPELANDSSADLGILALFTDSILNVTEGTKAAASLTISYDSAGKTYEEKKIEAVNFLGRNAMTWDDNRKAAAFVTAKDPAVLQFARSVTSKVHEAERRSIDENIQAALALHEALDLYGLDYVPNPITSYSEASAKKDVIDFLQFPRETFQYKAGDCSDISILYSSLLQAVGIDCAFVTIPGHIFVAVSTPLSSEQAQEALIPESEFIAYKGKVWIPVEITVRHQGFLKAWELGAKEWNENNPTGQAGFYPLQEAWTAYLPVGLPGVSAPIQMPGMDQVISTYQTEAQKYVDSAIYPQAAKLQAEIQQSGSVSSMNKLGVIYAKYGQMDKAEQEFKAVLAKQEYLPTLLNLGNLYYVRENWQSSLEYYKQASAKDPDNSHALIAIAKADQQLQNFDDMKQRYEQVKLLDPKLAEQYAYLGSATESATRAADIGAERRTVIWESE